MNDVMKELFDSLMDELLLPVYWVIGKYKCVRLNNDQYGELVVYSKASDKYFVHVKGMGYDNVFIQNGQSKHLPYTCIPYEFIGKYFDITKIS